MASSSWRLTDWEEHADVYDLFVENRKADIGFYADFADQIGGPVLEIGCGTGRILIEIARRGHSCTGMDFSTKMIEAFSKRIASLEDPNLAGRITLKCEDVLSSTLPDGTFSLAYLAFGALGLFIEDGEAPAVVKKLSKTLKQEGSLIVERRNRFADHYHIHREFDWIKKWTERNSVICQSHTDVIVDDTRKIRQTLYFYEGFDSNGEPFAFQQVLYFREFSSLESFMRESGLRVVARYGDYDRSFFSPEKPRA